MPQWKKKNTIESILERCIHQDDGCHRWIGSHDPNGYANCSWDSRSMKVCTILYQFFIGAIPPDKELDHLCRNKWCVNPEHLEAVSHKENTRRHYGRVDGFCIHGHSLVEDNIYKDPNGGRVRCRKCREIDE